MNRVTIILILLIISFSSCKDNNKHWTNEKLVNVLVDIHISEIAMKRQHVANKDSLFDVYFEKIAEIHKEERDEITEQVSLLMNDPARMSIVYHMIIENLQEKEELSKRKIDKNLSKDTEGSETKNAPK